jgi:hypothetical protein
MSRKKRSFSCGLRGKGTRSGGSEGSGRCRDERKGTIGWHRELCAKRAAADFGRDRGLGQRAHANSLVGDNRKVAGPVVASTEHLDESGVVFGRSPTRESEEDNSGLGWQLGSESEFAEVLVASHDDPRLGLSNAENVRIGRTRMDSVTCTTSCPAARSALTTGPEMFSFAMILKGMRCSSGHRVDTLGLEDLTRV